MRLKRKYKFTKFIFPQLLFQYLLFYSKIFVFVAAVCSEKPEKKNIFEKKIKTPINFYIFYNYETPHC